MPSIFRIPAIFILIYNISKYKTKTSNSVFISIYGLGVQSANKFTIENPNWNQIMQYIDILQEPETNREFALGAMSVIKQRYKILIPKTGASYVGRY